MNPKEFTTKWGQFTSDGELSEEEIAAMERLMEFDAVLRAEVAEDHELHRTLQSMGTIHDSQEEFVSDVMAACNNVDNPVAPLVDEEPTPGTPRQWKLAALLIAGSIGTAMLLVMAINARLGEAQARAEVALELAMQAQEQASRATELAIRQPNQPATLPAPKAVTEDPKTTPMKEPVLPKPVGKAVAVVVSETVPIWQGRVVNDQLMAGKYELASGEAVLRTTGGTILSLRSGTHFELHHSGHVTLKEGDMEIQVAMEDVGFRVSTPNSRVIDLGTKFQVSVSEQGKTRVQLDDGEVVVIPWQSGMTDTRWHLKSGEYEAAVMAGLGQQVNGLLGSYKSGTAGFIGAVKLGDSSVELSSIERFNHVFDNMYSKYQTDPINARAAWLRAKTVLARVRGNAEVDGENFVLDSLDAIMRAEEKMVVKGDDLLPKARKVRGSLEVAGKRHKFRTADEYEKVRSLVLQPLDALGVRSLSAMQRDQDKTKSPFKR